LNAAARVKMESGETPVLNLVTVKTTEHVIRIPEHAYVDLDLRAPTVETV